MKAYNVLAYLFYSNISLTLVIILLLFVRKISDKWMSARHRYYLWFILMIKLIMPFALNWSGNDLNLMKWFSKSLATDSNTAMGNVMNSYNSIPLIDNTKDYAMSVNNSNIYFIIIVLLILISIGFFSFIVLSSLRFKNKIIKSGYEPNNKLKVIIEACKIQLKMKNTKMNNLMVENGHSAFVIGLFKPYIIISKDLCEAFNEDEIKHVVLHEMVHIKRKDIILKFIMTIVCCIYWFNPFIWIARAAMMNDMELSCDEKVLGYLNKAEIRDYGRTIIKVLERISINRHKGIMLNINGSKKNIKTRIKNIAEFSKDSIGRKLFVSSLLVMTLVLAVSFIGVKTPFADDKSKNLNSKVIYKDFSSYFNGDEGTFVLFNEQNDEYTIFNKDGSEKRISPCSTYKIPLALIGLDNGVISKTDNNINWDGKNYPFPEWNKDQDLQSAMRYSVNWYFDSIDSRISKKTLQQYVSSLNYGNENIWTLNGEYWNQASLKISAIEQVEFLKKLWKYDKKFKKEDIDFVRNSIKLMDEDGEILYGKTGSGSENNKGVTGWFVGVLEKGNNKYYFATNIEGADNIDGAKAKNIALSILKTI